MKKIKLEIKNKSSKIKSIHSFLLPTSWHELSLRQFIEWQSIFSDETKSDIRKNIELIASLAKKDVGEIEKLHPTAFGKLTEVIAPMVADGFPVLDFDKKDYVLPNNNKKQSLLQRIFKRRKKDGYEQMLKDTSHLIEFEIKGEKYRWDADYFTSDMGKIGRMEQLLAGRDLITNSHYVLAICCVKEGEEFDLSVLDAKAQMMADELTMYQVYELLFFSFIRGASFFSFLGKLSLERAMVDQVLKKHNASLTVGSGTTSE